MSGNNDLDVVDFVARFARLAEAEDAAKSAAKDAERRRAALERRNKTMTTTSQAARSVAASNAPAPVKSAKLAVQNARRREAEVVYRAAVAEDAWTNIIAEAAERVGMTVVIPPRPGEVDHFDSNGKLVGRSKRVGNKITHYTSDGRVVGTTSLSGRKLFNRTTVAARSGSAVMVAFRSMPQSARSGSERARHHWLVRPPFYR